MKYCPKVEHEWCQMKVKDRYSVYQLLKHQRWYTKQQSRFLFRTSQGKFCINCFSTMPSSLNRLFHVGTCVFVKVFQERENEYAHEIMENLGYSSVRRHPGSLLIYNSKEQISSKNHTHGDVSFEENVTSILNMFKKISSYSDDTQKDVESEKYCNLLKSLVRSLPEMQDSQIIDVLNYLCLWPPTVATTTQQFKMLWNSLDRECLHRLESWTLEKQLLVADYWFHLRLSRITSYNSALIGALGCRLPSLSSQQLVQLLFLVNLQRKVNKPLMQNIEKYVMNLVDKLNIEEIGIICLGYFKTQMPTKNPDLLHHIIKHTINNMSIVNDFTVSAIVKQLRNSCSIQHRKLFKTFISECKNYIYCWEPTAGIHIVLLGTPIHVYVAGLIDKVVKHTSSNLQNIRLKELSKLLFSCALFNHTPDMKDFFSSVVAELHDRRREEEISLYPNCLISSLLFLAYQNIYPEKLLSKALDPTFLTLLQEKTMFSMSRELITLDYCVEIEYPQYCGPCLNREDFIETIKNNVGKIPETGSPDLTRQEKFTLDLKNDLVSILGGEHYINVTHALPHFYNPDIFLQFGQDGSVEPVPQDANRPVELILKPPEDKHSVCVMVCGQTCYTYENNHPVGLTMMKERQLQKLGYCVVQIPWFEYYKQPKGKTMKYLHQKIFCR
ncbi:FAST kinase domain-containing protein 5, mitochondrial isoform X2 [Tachypleus tridentatus]